MNYSTQKLIDQIVEDMNLLKTKMVFEMDMDALATISAFLFASAKKRADIDRYVECKAYLKDQVSVFSELRGIAQAIVVTKMCLASDYETYLHGVLEVYNKLRHIHKLTASPHMVMAAINIYEGGGLEHANENIASLERVYKEMKADHFWLTGDEDRPFIAMVVSRNISIRSILSEISECYDACKDMSLSKEAMHTASQIMSLSGRSVADKVEDLQNTITALKDFGVKGMKSDLMPLAAALGFIDTNPEDKARDIKEIYDYFKGQKGFKWYIGGTQRSYYSILVYALLNMDENKAVLNSVISTTLTNIIIQQVLLMSMIISSSNNSHSSHS